MKQMQSKGPDIDLMALLGNAPTVRDIEKTMSHMAKQGRNVVPALFKALPVEAKTDQLVLRQAFSLVEDPVLRAKMALYLVKTKLSLAYLIPVMEPALQSLDDRTLLFQTYLDHATIASHHSELMSLSHGRLVGFLVALDQLEDKDPDELYARAWKQMQAWEPQIQASRLGIPYSLERAIDNLYNARMWGDEVLIAYFKHNLSDRYKRDATVIKNAVGLLTRPNFFAPQLVEPILDAQTSERERLRALRLVTQLLEDRTNLLALYLNPQEAISSIDEIKSLNDDIFADLLLVMHRINRVNPSTARELIDTYLDADPWLQDSPMVINALTEKALSMDDNIAATVNALTAHTAVGVGVEIDSQLTIGAKVQVILKNIPEGELRVKALKLVFNSVDDVRAGLCLYLDKKTLAYARSRKEMKRDSDYFAGLLLALAEIKEMDLSANESLLALEQYLIAYPESYLIAKFLMHRTLKSEKPQFCLHIYSRLPDFLKILPDLTRLYLAGIQKSFGMASADQLELVPELAISLSDKAAGVYQTMQEQAATMKRKKLVTKQ